MRGLGFAFVASCILWCLLTWCTVCACPSSGSATSGLFDLLASFAFIGLAGIVLRLTAASFDDHEPEETSQA